MRLVSSSIHWAVKEGSRDSSPQWEQIRGLYRLGEGTVFFPSRDKARKDARNVRADGMFARPVRIRLIVEEIE